MTELESARHRIARRAALELNDGDFVNLGIGIPTLVTQYILSGVDVVFHSENGMSAMGPPPEEGAEDPEITNAGGEWATVRPGGAFFDTAFSFALARGGHVDVAILGALEADALGQIASWLVPGKRAPGMGGSMDLMAGARRVVAAMLHTDRGSPKIVERCSLPITGGGAEMIITELCVLRVTPEGLTLSELAPGVTARDVLALTAARLIVPDHVPLMRGNR